MKDTSIKEIDKEVVDADDSQVYEIGYHLLPLVAEESVPATVSLIRDLIVNLNGNILSEGSPAMRQLAYDIFKKIDTKNMRFNKAYFGWIKFEMGRDAVLGFKSKVESIPEILRFLIVKTVKENTMSTPKIPSFRKENNKDENPVEDVEKPAISEEEMDKSIDELVIN